MIILEKPYVSPLLEDTLVEFQFPVLKNKSAEELNISSKVNFVDEKTLIEEFKANSESFIYSNSEDSINWINNNLAFSVLPEKIDIFKNKVKFRQLISEIYPDFFFKEVCLDDLDELDISAIKKPFIIKPAVGFCSMGVYFVSSDEDWANILKSIKIDMEKVKGLYPIEVMNSSKFIIEQNISGDEYAVDAYFDQNGEPVILNIFKHVFSSEKDVSDRVYLTSKDIIESNLDNFTDLLSKIGNLSNLSKFPLHLEVRIDENNNIIPIEVNPMRFAGWCVTDMAYFAYGINPYRYYLEQLKPDWKTILADKGGKLFSFVFADVPMDINRENILDVNYDSFFGNFSKVLEMRKIDYTKYPVFAFAFIESQSYSEITNILNDDFHKYFKVKN